MQKVIPNARTQGGFTLLELLISTAILAILVTIGAGAYADYTAKAQAAEGSQMAAGAMQAWEAAYADAGGVAPVNNTQAGLPAAADLFGDYVQIVDLSASGILVAFRSDAASNIAGGVYYYVPHVTAGNKVLWRCGNGTAPTDPTGTAVPIAPGITAPVAPVNGNPALEAALPRTCRA